MKCKKTPKYKITGIVLVAFIIYSLLMSPISVVHLVKNLPNEAEIFLSETDTSKNNTKLLNEIDTITLEIEKIIQEIKKIDTIAQIEDTCLVKTFENVLDSLKEEIRQKELEMSEKFDNIKDKHLENPMIIYVKFALLALLFIFIFNFPIKIFFNKKRRNIEPNIKIEKFTKKYLHKTPFINSLILFAFYFIMHVLMLIKYKSSDVNICNTIDKEIYSSFLIISVCSSILVIIFIYIWQKYRISNKYLEVVYSKQELKKRLPNLNSTSISKRLLLSSLMTTFLPLMTVFFYVFISITKVKNLGIEVFTPEISEIILGNYSEIADFGSKINNFIYVNAIDTFLMIYGIIVGSIVAIIYIAFFVKLTAGSIIVPIKELVQNMKSFKKGIQNYTVVRTNDEIGLLAEEFNNMGDRINSYISEINKMNEELEQKVIERTSEIRQQKEEIETQKDEIEAQRDEIEKQRDYVIEQRDRIATQNKHITDSIEYAKRIQNAVLTPFEDIKEILNDFFIFYRPRDIVSGDFYWTEQTSEYKIFTVADCTGHGVPGAFMSMLGLAFLKEIFNKKNFSTPSDILNELRTEIKLFLRQTGKDKENKDGMDIALCMLDQKHQKLMFAGANNQAIITRKKDGEIDLFELKPDRMPIGVYIGKEKPFETKVFDLQKGDTIYIFSDGFIDQFGGDTGRKFLIRNFKDLLKSIHNQSLEEQKETLISTFDEWKGEKFEQIDDVLIFGFKV